MRFDSVEALGEKGSIDCKTEAIDAGKYQAANTDITAKNFPSTREGKANLEIASIAA